MKRKDNLRLHVESLHFKNVFSYECDKCDQALGSKKALTRHKQRYHNNVWMSYERPRINVWNIFLFKVLLPRPRISISMFYSLTMEVITVESAAKSEPRNQISKLISKLNISPMFSLISARNAHWLLDLKKHYTITECEVTLKMFNFLFKVRYHHRKTLTNLFPHTLMVHLSVTSVTRAWKEEIISARMLRINISEICFPIPVLTAPWSLDPRKHFTTTDNLLIRIEYNWMTNKEFSINAWFYLRWDHHPLWSGQVYVTPEWRHLCVRYLPAQQQEKE